VELGAGLAATEARARRLGADVLRIAERYDVDTASDLSRLIRTLLVEGLEEESAGGGSWPE
jgi:hypothetical protein